MFQKNKSETQKYKSEAWQHFLRNFLTEEAKCLHCSAILKCTGGSTKGLLTHLKRHDFFLLKGSANI